MPELVSVVMPCHRAAETLELAVNGVLQQTYVQLELLLLVDGDEAATLALARQLAAADARIRLLCSAHNRGVVRARNLGIRLAKGSWLAFCDADDHWLPDKLELQLQLAARTGANVMCSTFWFCRPDRARNQTRLAHLPKKLQYATMLRTNAIPMSTALYQTAVLGKHYFEALPQPYIHEDYAYWLRLMQNTAVQAQCLQQPTTLIRVMSQSRSANKWLALRSHAYILHRVAGLRGFKHSWAMLAYGSWALRKRLKGQHAAAQHQHRLPAFVL